MCKHIQKYFYCGSDLEVLTYLQAEFFKKGTLKAPLLMENVDRKMLSVDMSVACPSQTKVMRVRA